MQLGKARLCSSCRFAVELPCFFLVVEVHALQEDYKSAIDVYTEAQNHSNHKSGELGDSHSFI